MLSRIERKERKREGNRRERYREEDIDIAGRIEREIQR